VADPVALPGPGAGSGRDTPAWLGVGWTRLLVLGAAVSFLCAAIGYTVGARRGTGASAVDIGFLQDMSDHHEQARTLAIIAGDRTTDATVRDLTRRELIDGQYELGVLHQSLADLGAGPGDPGRTAGAWMGVGSPVASLPGMATSEQVQALHGVRGAQADLLYVSLMVQHHRGAFTMADSARARAENEQVRRLATGLADRHAGQMREYEALQARLRDGPPVTTAPG
jgi:uncharacterized protein (DUF305 family)